MLKLNELIQLFIINKFFINKSYLFIYILIYNFLNFNRFFSNIKIVKQLSTLIKLKISLIIDKKDYYI